MASALTPALEEAGPSREVCVSKAEYPFPEYQMELYRSRASQTRRAAKAVLEGACRKIPPA